MGSDEVKKKKPTLREYSKRIIKAMIALWFAGAVFGAVIIVVELIAMLKGVDGYGTALTVHLPELLTYIGMPVSGGIVGYLLKSAFENRTKIQNSAAYSEYQQRTNNYFDGGNYRE